ncbi:hypothetical protein GWI33_007127 [Rhynchophorus ferrugineus]|uniref:Nuclear pore complex protein Nup98-Nup96 n=1 Tax=Rhynchophorus ferrugineus TaxID=354439 RepID=A0A834IY40_RHYFE|nr:hypothetical protein GWI33_007127 [Rhynchophorus ferrugineus]
MFGKTTFGATAPSTSFNFGQTTPAANPFGQNQSLFGKPATGFGAPSTSTFGQATTWNTNSSGFGTAPTTQSGFGSTGLFGQQSTSGGLFNSSTTFGQQNKPTGFGFGSPQPTTGLFGPQQPQTSNIFNTSGNSGLFGAPAFGTQQTGTVSKFNPVTGTDTMLKNGTTQSINTKHHSITCMKEYESKSFEELRFEDYQANRKGPQQTTGFGTPAFGAASTTAPLFGQTDANKSTFGQSTAFAQPFGQNTTNTFGLGGSQQNTTSPFGAKPTAFGAPTSTSNFGFGSNTTQNANPFGAASANKPFGTATSQPLFGASTTQANTGFGTGLFSNTQNTGANLFNKPAQPTSGFGTQQTGFSFNNPSSTQPSLFTSTTKPLFGNATSSAPAFGSTIGFGSNNTSFNSNTFGKSAAPVFGPSQTNSYGPNLGGMSTNQNTGIFGSATQPKTGLFGSTHTAGSLFVQNVTQNPNFGIGQPQLQLIPVHSEQSTSNLALLTRDPFGDAPHLAGLEPKLKIDNAAVSATDPKELKSLLDPSKKVDMSHNSKLKVTPLKNIRDSLFDSIPSPEELKSPTTNYYKNSFRRLVVKPRGDSENNSLSSSNILDMLAGDDKENSDKNKTLNDSNKGNPLRLQFDTTIQNDSLINNSIETQTYNIINSTTKENTDELRETVTQLPNVEHNLNKEAGGDSLKEHPANIICTRPEYYTLPSLNDLVPDENGSCIVKGFTVGRKGYGNVYFLDEMDVSGLNIDKLIHFRYREINVYPDETIKPPVGQGLNRKAQVTLDNIYPRRSGSNVLIKDVGELLQMNFAEKLRKVTEKKNARFIDYRPETGSWVFKVDHFSKYGFNESDDENEQNAQDPKKKAIQKPHQATENRTNIAQGDKIKEALEKAQKEKDSISPESTERLKPPSTFGLDKDILIDDDDDEQHDRDVLHHSMFVDDTSEEDYHHIPSEIPVDLHFSSYKNAKNIQVMKSTLFADDDRSSEDAGSQVSMLKQYLDLPEVEDMQRLPPLQEEVQIRKRAVIRPRVMKVLNSYDQPESTVNLLPSRCCVDMGLFKGKSFKVGWSKGYSFLSTDTEDKVLSSELLLKEFDASPDFDPLKDVLTDSLKVVLDQSTYHLSSSKIPIFNILKTDTYLKCQTEIFEKLSLQYNSVRVNYLHSVWTLCTALWGPSENSVANRRHLLTEWLKISCNTDEISLEKGPFKSTEDAVEAIFMHLSIFKVFEAAGIAIDNKMPNLSLLLAQLSVSNDTKLFIQEHIESWYCSLTSNHITKGMKKLYLLLAGIPTKDEVNIFDNVDWKRAFGMHLWYICPNGSPLENAIDLYTASFREHLYAERPNPPHAKQFVEDGPFDILYHILLLYKSGVHRLSSVLNPATHTNDPLDYRLSWLLLQLFISIDVGLIEKSEINKITVSFSNQLEHSGNWEWAIFVLLYLEDDLIKKNAILGILDRNLNVNVDSSQDIVDLLVNEMKIPADWIHVVKGQKTLAAEKYFEAFNHFSLADDYVTANQILIEHLLPDLFINEQFDVLRSLIDKVKCGSGDIQHWNNEAGLILDYLDLLEQNITADNLIKLQVKLTSIGERIVNFPLTSQQHKVCIAELSKKCASLYKELFEKSQTASLNDSYTQFIETLIMPPDYKQIEGLYLIHNFHNFTICRQ